MKAPAQEQQRPSGAGQVLHTPPRMGTFSFKKHHGKPLRKRHVLLAMGMYGLVVASGVGLGIIIGRAMDDPPAATVKQPAPKLTTKRSAAFSFDYDTQLFTLKDVEEKGMQGSVVKLKPGLGLAADIASQLSVLSVTDGVATVESAQQQFAPTSNDEFVVEPTGSSSETIANVAFTKYVYAHSPKFKEDNPTVYSVHWIGTVENRVMLIKAEGLVGSPALPALYAPLLASLKFNGQPAVLGFQLPSLLLSQKETPELAQKYIADTISPAVVKVYSITCGTIYVDGQRASSYGCNGVVGSGFFVSSDGYVATNGHVVVYSPKDAFVQLLFNEPEVFADYLRSSGLKDGQIAALGNRPDLLAAVVAQIYELPDTAVELREMKQAVLIAHGDEPLEAVAGENLDSLFRISDTDTIKRAEVIATDFSSKDIYVITAGDTEGFSSSDVALLKVDIDDTPFIASLNDSIITQNQAISVLGFPSDAENQLIDTSQLAVTVTNGTIGSIRTAAGGEYRLFQSDADASQGSSGGPAITADGQVFGLLTYRFKSETAQDAAKSYIRDFEDVKQLALTNDIHFRQTGTVQENWELGIRWYAAGYYSEALSHFALVEEAFPSHRLVSEYTTAAKLAIENGQDIPATTVNALAVGLTVGLLGTLGAGALIVRHHARHKLYLLHSHHGLHHAS